MAAHDPASGAGEPSGDAFAVSSPQISLPKGGGAIRDMGEKFATHPATGTGSIAVPIPAPAGRSGFGPSLTLLYDSGAGHGPFGFGWSLSLPAITRKTDKGLPRYAESDTFLLSGCEDLTPTLAADGARFVDEQSVPEYIIHRYRPRIEGLFARIERWTRKNDGDVHWRSIGRDNVLTIYGKDASSRIVAPEDSTRIFSWLICETRDDKGNAIVYRYKADDARNVDLTQAHERNRGDFDSAVRKAARYLHRVQYGNRDTLLDAQRKRPAFVSADQLAAARWMFEIVFDYGNHSRDAPRPDEPDSPALAWPCRADPFSSYRAGFEVRTYRLCQRVLVFHHFPADPDVGANCLVRSLQLEYSSGAGSADADFSFLTSIAQQGHKRQGAGYRTRSLPPLQLEYSRPVIDETLRELDAESLENLPVGAASAGYQWVDLDGEGLPGVLSAQRAAWFYKRNVSAAAVQPDDPQRAVAKFAPLQVLDAQPATATSTVRMLDLAGDGQLDVVRLEPGTGGFYERDDDGGWQPFTPFESQPTTRWDDECKLIDLTGDGCADLFVSEDETFCWYESLGERGFAAAQRLSKALDEERGPRVVFSDPTHTIFLADLSGDGLTDIVRIRPGEVCYWPNLGYGRFGAKVTMDNAPTFESASLFDASRIRLADIDGSGLTDIVYLASDGVHVYFNRSGNRWSDKTLLAQCPPPDSHSTVSVLDLLGNGTACLLWSSVGPADAGRPARYVDLMSGRKPHLLIGMDNNVGARTRIEYTPSTRFYLEDERAGRPWATRLPFPVQCVSKVTVSDRWRQLTLSNTYSYHHGYFDSTEREFRGFGRVEQVDVECYGEFAAGNVASPFVTDDRRLFQPPVQTITWYHTGAPLESLLPHFAREYLQPLRDRPLVGGFQERSHAHVELRDGDLSAIEWREALRACKGKVLRTETYQLDVDALDRKSDPARIPTRLLASAASTACVQRIQRGDARQRAVFLVTEREATQYHYELDLATPTLQPDPRVAHTFNLSFDAQGNVQQSVTIAYARFGQFSDPGLPPESLALIRAVQNERHVAYVETRYTNDVDTGRDYRTRLAFDVKTYELTGLEPGVAPYFELADLTRRRLSAFYPGGDDPVAEIPYHENATGVTPQKRLVEHARTLFFDDANDGAPTTPGAPGALGALGLPFERYQLAFTDALLSSVLQSKLTAPVRAKLADAGASGYLTGAALASRFSDLDATGQYWIRSGIAGFAANAPQRFFLPERYTDAFGAVSTIEHDADNLLFVSASTDARGNTTTVMKFDSRVLAPAQVCDPNDNLSEALYDVLGRPVATALRGKGNEGDRFAGLTDATLDPSAAELAAFFAQADLDEAQARAWLLDASSRLVYYLGDTQAPDGTTIWGTHPACALSVTRERHVAALGAGQTSALQASFDYHDGFGNIVVKKVQAEPAAPGQPLRWIASGKTILNNKAKPVKKFEPYFSAPAIGHRFEEPEEVGVTAVMYYDALGRVLRTEMPDGSYTRATFSPWELLHYDQNDTAAEPGNAWFAANSAAAASAAQQRAAQLASAHADTPSLTVLDSLGRNVIAIAHNRYTDEAGVVRNEKYLTYTKLDAEGKPLWIRDPRGNLLVQHITPLKPTRRSDEPNPAAAETIPAASTPCYDIAGRVLYAHSMDAGDRWTLNDAAGGAMLAWDFNQRIDDNGASVAEQRMYETRYDVLRRPVEQWLHANGAAPQMVERFEYVDAQDNLADAKARNLCRTLVRHYDPSGLTETVRLDFKGQPNEIRRRLRSDYKAASVDWQGNPAPALEAETFTRGTEYDALSRPTRIYSWHKGVGTRVAVYEPKYGARRLLVAEDLVIGAVKSADGYDEGAGARRIHAITAIAYDAKGQRQSNTFGNGTLTTYAYDARTFRLAQLRTTRAARVLQGLRYTYDALGNIAQIDDDAYEPEFFDNQAVEARSLFTYDALNRLLTATGRENGAAAGAAGQFEPLPVAVAQYPVTAANALRNYSQRYRYDAVGNIEQVRHAAGNNGWTRTSTYAPDGNRLLTTATGNPAESATYQHDAHGNVLNLADGAPQGQLRWDHRDMLHVYDRGGGGRVYYNYDAVRQRSRKVNENQAGTRKEWERLDLGGMEIFRRYGPAGLVDEVETFHLMDGDRRVLLVEDVRQSSDPSLPLGPLQRYQYGNHLGSAALELDDQARILTYEEYFPFGSTAYRSASSAIRAATKRYRYTGKERDSESGLNYHGARYYAPWLARWISCDPISHLNLYVYCANNPNSHDDPTGRQAREQYKADVTGKETPEQVRKMFAAKDIFYTGEATWVKSGEGGYWHIHDWQVIARETGKQLNMRADVINSHNRPPKPKQEPPKPTLAQIRAKREEDWDVAKKGMWNAAVDMAVPMWLPDSAKDRLKYDAPKPTGDALRDYELKESYEGGQTVTVVVATAVSMLPIAETAEAAQLAASKMPKPAGGLGIIAQDFVSFSDAWALESNMAGKAPKPAAPIYGNPQVTGPGHAEKMVEVAENMATTIEDAEEVFMHSRWSTITDGELASGKLPDVAMKSTSGTYTAVEVPSAGDLRSARTFGSLIARNLKELLKLGKKSDGLFIIFKD